MVAGRYVLLDQIGTGGMGSVWRAWDERTRCHVAVKVLGRHSSALLARFVREFRERKTSLEAILEPVKAGDAIVNAYLSVAIITHGHGSD